MCEKPRPRDVDRIGRLPWEYVEIRTPLSKLIVSGCPLGPSSSGGLSFQPVGTRASISTPRSVSVLCINMYWRPTRGSSLSLADMVNEGQGKAAQTPRQLPRSFSARFSRPCGVERYFWLSLCRLCGIERFGSVDGQWEPTQ